MDWLWIKLVGPRYRASWPVLALAMLEPRDTLLTHCNALLLLLLLLCEVTTLVFMT